ncbi:MAG: adenosine deaminase, partial [Pseudomonadota bacterium]
MTTPTPLMTAHRAPQRLPKAELHCHIEGTVAPVVAQRLAQRHGLDLSHVIDEQGRYIWSDFKEFLGAYDAMTAAIQTPEDYYDLTVAYYEAAAEQGLRYGEMFISADHPKRHGISYPTFLDAVTAGLKDVAASHGVHARLILTAVRHYGVEHSLETARLAQKHPHPFVVGFGIAGDEAHLPHSAFTQAFEIAADAGLRLTGHAGEHMGPEGMWSALKALKLERFGHGVRAHEDPDLV